jgi:hypothetical protein
LFAGGAATKDGYPQLVGGLLSPRHKNLYVFGTSQARYGAGPLISAGAEAVCAMIEVQPRLRRPIGAVLRRLGLRSPETNIADPHALLRAARMACFLCPWLPLLERVLPPA